MTKNGQHLGSRSQIQSSLSTVSDSKLMLWHQRLGHPSFNYLKTLYPYLFINKEVICFIANATFLQNKSNALILLMNINLQNTSI